MSNNKLKIIFLGETSVGKSSIIKRYITGNFEELFISTIGADFFDKTISINDTKITLEIMDTCGQERYKSLSQNYIRNADGIIFVFDVTNTDSFNAIKKWLITAEETETNFQKILVGNKIDLKDLRLVLKENMMDFAEKKNMKCFETSAKDNINIELIFKEIAELICINSPEKLEKISKSKQLGNSKSINKKKCC